jgi:hypothetical protein
MCNCKKHIDKKCVTCGQMFGVCNYKKDTAKYCSRKCIRSPQHVIDAIIKANTGRVPWNKGLYFKPNDCLEEWRKNGGSHKGRKAYWIMGDKNPMKKTENKEKIRQSKLGSKNPMYGKCGEKHPNWNGGTSTFRERIMASDKYKNWRTRVFERDGYTCQICLQEGSKLHAHHILPFSNFENFRLTLQNGVTLCVDCHKLIKNKEWLYAPKFLGT